MLIIVLYLAYNERLPVQLRLNLPTEATCNGWAMGFFKSHVPLTYSKFDVYYCAQYKLFKEYLLMTLALPADVTKDTMLAWITKVGVIVPTAYTGVSKLIQGYFGLNDLIARGLTMTESESASGAADRAANEELRIQFRAHVAECERAREELSKLQARQILVSENYKMEQTLFALNKAIDQQKETNANPSAMNAVNAVNAALTSGLQATSELRGLIRAPSQQQVDAVATRSASSFISAVSVSLQLLEDQALEDDATSAGPPSSSATGGARSPKAKAKPKAKPKVVAKPKAKPKVVAKPKAKPKSIGK